MKRIDLSTSKIENTFQEFNQNFGGTLRVDYGEHILKLDNDLGKGFIRGISFDSNISYLEFNMIFKEDCQITIRDFKDSPIHFAYCSQGNFTHRLKNTDKLRKLDNFQTGILACQIPAEHLLLFRKNIELKVSLISINTLTNDFGTPSNLQKELKKTFLQGKENFVYIGTYNLKIVDKIRQLDAIIQKGIVRKLLIKGLVHTILALEIQQHSDDMASRENSIGTLTHHEMDRVHLLSSFIENNPEKGLSISYLSAKSGLSPCKLQQGFKLMHGRTVAEYIREVRVEKGEELIINTDLNISEVVYSIGFTSRSYFSKIFKQKYKCTPNKYKQNQARLDATA